jgi:hypothetical protein
MRGPKAGRLLVLSGLAVLAMALVLCSPAGAGAQLISPGKLSSAHAHLFGIRDCTQCHELRTPGISEELCLKCHTPLADRLRAEKGFHSSLQDRACGTCHKEHFGEDFALVRIDTLAFDHQETGYSLEGSHIRVTCRSCHNVDHLVDAAVRTFKAEGGGLERTFLGLAPSCASCHEEDAPHEGQFARRECSDCHDPGAWDEARPFDHETTAYPLRGEHERVTCDMCHETTHRAEGRPDLVQYADVAHGRCNDCHEDQHRGAMPGQCVGCHTTEGWGELDKNYLETSLNHRAMGFPLEGRHGEAPCASCHTVGQARGLQGIHLTFQAGTQGNAYPTPEAAECVSCHEDEHDGFMSPGCQACHTPAGWEEVDPEGLAASFDHGSTGYDLEGRHADASCDACHDAEVAGSIEGLQLAFEPGTELSAFPGPGYDNCMACHQNRHQGTFQDAPSGPECRGCHGVHGWSPASFDAGRHDQETRFRLEGAHAVVACVDCHLPSEAPPTFSVEGTDCAACHREGDPHGEQFIGRACNACHNTHSFDIPQFDHDRTRFPLDGAHEGAACPACHVAEMNSAGTSIILYSPLAMECRDCHGGSS